MSLKPSRDVFITCAITGAGDTVGRSDKVPVTPAQIADAVVEAARAGAAIAHVHVRDPNTGQPAREKKLYSQVVERVRASKVDVVLNLTAGMGGDLVLGDPDHPLPLVAASTDLASAEERLAHVRELTPEICTLDCGSMNFGEGDYVMTNTPAMLKAMAAIVQQLKVRPEIEVFDTGQLLLAKWLHAQGVIDEPVMVQLCMGVPWGAPDDIPTFMSMVNNLPTGWVFSTFSISRNQLPYVGLAIAAGGNIRVGLEDNIWLDKGVLASNGALVARAVTIAEAAGSKVMGPQAVRDRLALTRRW